MSDAELVRWMGNFSEKLPGVVTDLGLPETTANKLEEHRTIFENALIDEKLLGSTHPLQMPSYDERGEDKVQAIVRTLDGNRERRPDLGAASACAWLTIRLILSPAPTFLPDSIEQTEHIQVDKNGFSGA